MLVVEQWAELRRLHFIEHVPIRELARRKGLQRATVRRAIRSADPPKYSRPVRSSKVDPFKPEIARLLKDEPRLPVVRLRELLQPLGYVGGESILKEHVREVRPLFLTPRTYQRTVYLPGEIAQCDLWEPGRELPVGFGLLTCDNLEQAEARAGGVHGNKGWDAAVAALEMADLMQHLDVTDES